MASSSSYPRLRLGRAVVLPRPRLTLLQGAGEGSATREARRSRPRHLVAVKPLRDQAAS